MSPWKSFSTALNAVSGTCRRGQIRSWLKSRAVSHGHSAKYRAQPNCEQQLRTLLGMTLLLENMRRCAWLGRSSYLDSGQDSTALIFPLNNACAAGQRTGAEGQNQQLFAGHPLGPCHQNPIPGESPHIQVVVVSHVKRACN